MRVRILLCLLALCLVGNTSATGENDGYTLYLIRHAEKQPDGSHDPALTNVGKHRSDQLANWFKDKQIKDIWSSDYQRTRDTAGPLLAKLGLELFIYDPRNQAALVEKLMKNQNTSLIVGHSNTIPDLARMICHCDIADMADTEHDRLIVISVVGSKTKVNILQQNLLFQP